ncbi:hypothetical protein [Photobacterium kishitanii]|uniref:Uncharacterized protein n=1 Tax=Photobacterium kishitanii TaxID=318456 RepID=A0A2T3KL39_9GAMM|nr:hypothetical protein [Photobacterium kishitanii]PSV00434.1 hypothetical protein C9J27_04700 [Photobacterium kishitanii]
MKQEVNSKVIKHLDFDEAIDLTVAAIMTLDGNDVATIANNFIGDNDIAYSGDSVWLIHSAKYCDSTELSSYLKKKMQGIEQKNFASLVYSELGVMIF